MQIWLVTVGEPLPGLSSGSRLWRTGLLAELLTGRGHDVVWWTSLVDHFRKARFPGVPQTRVLQASPSLTLRFLDGCLYRRNVSLRRLVNHWQIGRQFARESHAARTPDIILCSFPTIELSREAVRFGAALRVPVILDVRDLWPDIFLTALPPPVRTVAEQVLRPYAKAARQALFGADSVIAVSQSYLDWGVTYARRVPRAEDQVFPLAYHLPISDIPDRAAALSVLEGYGVSPGCLTCVFAGTLGWTYDLAPVLDVAARFAGERNSAYQFLICGDGERAPEWRSRAAGLPNVAFTGWLDQVKMRAALALADVGIAAYAKDAPQGIPNKVVEYLAAELPVVSSLTGESERLLRKADCGITYIAGEPDSLYHALSALTQDELRNRLSHNARQTFETQFRADVIYSRLADHLEGVAITRREKPSNLAPGPRQWTKETSGVTTGSDIGTRSGGAG